MNNLDYLIGYIRENPRTYLIVVMFGTAIGLFEFVGIASLLPAVALMLGEAPVGLPKVVANIFDKVGAPIVIGAYFALVLLQAWIAYASEAYFLREMAKWRTKLTLDYVRNVLQADFFASRDLKPGEAEIIITRNIGYAVRNRHRTALFLTDGVLAIFYALIALVVSPHAFVLFIMLGAIYGLLHRRLTGLRVAYSKQSGLQYQKAAQLVSEYLYDFRGLQTLNKSLLEQSVRKELELASRAQEANDIINAGIRLSSQPIMLLLVLAGLGMSKFLFAISNAQILVMLFVFFRAAPKFIALARGYGEIIQDSPVDITPEILRWHDRRRKLPERREESVGLAGILFRGVDFFHEDKLILKDVNMDVQPGELVALVGRSGSGKSTLLDLLCGFTRPQVGEIRVWGQDPATIRYEDWLMPRVSLLRPESVLITGSVASNIALLEEAPDRERIAGLVHRVGLEDILGKYGLDTPIQARGNNLSAGQRQRLLLARALYKSPALLILDEPTSNLDERTEHDINQLLASLKGSITMVVVSHRGKLLKEANLIYRIEGQTLVAETHANTQLH